MQKALAPVSDDRRKGFSFFPFVVIALIVGVGAYMLWGLQRSYNKVEADDANRAATQSQQQGLESRSRVDGERERSSKLANVDVRPAPTFDASKLNLPPGQQSAPQPAPSSPPKENPNAAKVREIENGLSSPKQ